MNYTKRSRSPQSRSSFIKSITPNSKRNKKIKKRSRSPQSRSGSEKINRKLFGSQSEESESLTPTQVEKRSPESLTPPTQVVKRSPESLSPRKSRSTSPSKKRRSTEQVKNRSSSLSSTKEEVYQSPNKNPFAEFITKKKVFWYEPKLGRYVTINEMYQEYEQFEKNKNYMNSWNHLLNWSPSPSK
jgi:hypothetical protein